MTCKDCKEIISRKIKEEITRQVELEEVYSEDGAPGTSWACRRTANILKNLLEYIEQEDNAV